MAGWSATTGSAVDFRQLETLLAVAEEGSFTAAADRLHTVQSNVSEHIRQLEALLAVAEEGSFTAAADRLHTVQSNVSGHVQQLESELGVQLLVRSRRGTVPTEFGTRVLDRARAVRSEIEALHKDVSMLQGLETGHATLGVVGTVSRSLVPIVVSEIRLRPRFNSTGR